MKREPTTMERRHDAIEATMARYRDRPFEWGSVDCAKVAAFHLKQLGHKIAISKAGRYSNALGANRAIRRMGYASLPELLDGLGLVVIPPAYLLLGDLVQTEGDSALGAIGIYAGNGNIFGFHEDHPGLVTMQPKEILRAWRAI